MFRSFVAMVVLAGCGGGGECTALVDGPWTFDGAAGGGMEMTGEITMDADACKFTIGAWEMEMTNTPSGGSIEGDQLTLEGDDIPEDCVGTVNADGTAVTGACADGSAFSMSQG
jgi:hypothetical protein